MSDVCRLILKKKTAFIVIRKLLLSSALHHNHKNFGQLLRATVNSNEKGKIYFRKSSSNSFS